MKLKKISLYNPSTKNKKRMIAKYINVMCQMLRIKKKIKRLPERQKHRGMGP